MINNAYLTLAIQLANTQIVRSVFRGIIHQPIDSFATIIVAHHINTPIIMVANSAQIVLTIKVVHKLEAV